MFAVSVSGCPNTTELGAEESVVAVEALPTFTASGAELLGKKFASPA